MPVIHGVDPPSHGSDSMMLLILWILGYLGPGGVWGLETVRLRGLGATFPSNVYENWLFVYDYARRRHVDLDTGYDMLGSAYGIEYARQDSAQVDFTASDIVLRDQDYEEHPDLAAVPVVAG